MGAGTFSISFTQEYTPTAIIESIKEWGHIVITPQSIDVNSLSDSDILSSARYTGIILNRTLEEGIVSINGQGLELYLGDGSGKGMVIAESNNIGKVRTYTDVTLSEALFNSVVSSGKPYGIMRDETGASQAIIQGTIYNPSTLYTGQHFVETALSALKFVSEILNTEYRINPDGTIDAGPAANLFVGVGSNEPTSVVVKSAYGEDPQYEGVTPQGLRSEFDATDWVSRVDFTGEVGYFDIATDVAGEANLTSNPYKDLHGNALKRVGLVQEPDVPEASLNARAQSMLNELSRVKKILNLDLTQYEVSGDMKVGDFIYAFDPDVGFVDTDVDAAAESRDKYEITFRGQTITPAKVRIIGLTFPIIDGMGVYFRDKDGNYTDLTQYLNYESGSTQVELGDGLRSLKDDLRFNEFSLSREQAGVFSIPDLPSTPSLQSGTYLDSTGESKGFIRVTVSKPTNIDGSQITDGESYKVRYKKITDTEYSYMSFPFTGASSETLLLQDLTVGATYQIGVAAVDKSGFKKMSAYDSTGEDLYTDSSSINPSYTTNARIEIEKDGQAPSQPKQATIATGPLRVQITHYLGKAGTDSGGNPYGDFTLEGDLDHLDIHAVTQDGNTETFTVATSNKIGEVKVNSGNLLQEIPVVANLELPDSEDYYFRIVAVDKSGNASDPSAGQSGNATLMEQAYIGDAAITTAKIGEAAITNAKIADATITSAKINDLSADKITSGTITGGEITVGGVSNTSGFIQSYNFSSGSAGWQIAADGSAEFQNATIRGTLNASDITTGTLDASTITVTNLNATNITTGTLNVDRLPTITTSQINFTASDIDGVDPDTILATINASSEGIKIDADKLTLTGVLEIGDDITSGTIGGWTINSSSITGTDGTNTVTLNSNGTLYANYTAGSSGWLIEADGDAFFNSVDVRLGGTAGTGAPGTIAGAKRFDLGNSQVFEYGSRLWLSSPAVMIWDSDYSASSTSPSLQLFGTYAQPGWYVDDSQTGRTKLYYTSGNSNAFHTESDRQGLFIDGAIYFGNDSGSSGEYIGKDSNGAIGWHSTTAIGGNYYSNQNQLTINNNNGVITVVTGNTSNTLAVGHNHPYGTGNGNSNLGAHDNSYHNTDYAASSHGHNAYALSGHGHGNTYAFYEHYHDDRYVLSSNHSHSNFASNNYVNGQITSHVLDYWSGHNSSDRRVKTDIVDTTLGLDFINRLQPRDFNWTEEYKSQLDNYVNPVADRQKELISNTQQGFIAQEVQSAVFAETGSNNAFSGVAIKNITADEVANYPADDPYGKINYESFVVPLVKAVQQLSAKIDVLEARIDELEGV